MKIGLLSDTHGYLDPGLFEIFNDVDEIWHAGDIGTIQTADQLSAHKYLRAVYGNIDGPDIRQKFPKYQIFKCEKITVLMTHIGGKPGRYEHGIKRMLENDSPGLFICGHSHILKIMYDKTYDMMYMNPGAAGQTGLHHVKTVVRFSIKDFDIFGLEVIELGKRLKK